MHEMTRTRPFLREVHSLRGVAILSVVMVHVFGTYLDHLSQVGPLDKAGKVFRTAIEIGLHGSTVYFASISGLLFSSVLVADGWVRFYRNKFLHVAVPYAVMTLIFSMLSYEPGVGGRGLVFSAQEPGALFSIAAAHFMRGTALPVYWYIPVLICLYMLTPIVYALVSRVPAVTLMFVVSPLLVSRTGTLVTIQSVVYFAGAYGIGVFLGMNYERNLAWMRQRGWALALICVLATLGLALLFWRRLDLLGPVSLREAFFFVQKLSLSAVLIGLLNHWQERLPRIVNHVATHAFSIYFLHLFVLYGLLDFALRLLPMHSTAQVFAIGLLLFVLTVGASLLVSIASRMMLGRYSRLLVGA